MTTLTLDWQQIASFFVPGEPKAQPRPRARAIPTSRRRGNRCGCIAQVYNPGDADGWKKLVGNYSMRHRPAEKLLCPVRLDMVVFMPRPKYMEHHKYSSGPLPYTAKPDRDNLDKAVLDALGDIDWWRDDAQVCAGEVVKVYHALGGQPGALITVSVLQDNQPDLFGGEATS